MLRVAALMEGWAQGLGLEPSDVERWRRAGWLHDCLRDADPERLRAELPPPFRDLPGPVLHGPAAAERLGNSVDAEVADAIRYHTLGHEDWGALGRALYLADHLEPGRPWAEERRASLRDRMPGEMHAVLAEVLRDRLTHLLAQKRAVSAQTIGLWNATVARRS